jgi:glutamine amidotransferase
MLCVVPPNVIPSKDKLMASALNNPHGFGFAIVVTKERRIIVEKTMNPDTAVNRFLELRAQYPDDYAMWHARLATHGSMTLDNCHPFPVGGDTQTYLGHNGILPVLEDKTDRSDTRIFAEDVLASMGGVKALDNEQLLNIIEDFSTGSKLCILTVDPQAKQQCYLVHEDKGKVDEAGVWWSNDSCSWTYGSYYTTKKSYVPYADGYGMADDEDIYSCPNCRAILDEYMVEYGMCEFCQSCLDCSADYELCLCYDPKASSYSNDGWIKDKPTSVNNQPLALAWGKDW